MSHEIKEGVQHQLSNEGIVYDIDVSAVTATPANPAIVDVIKESSGQDVKTTVMPSGSPTIYQTTKVRLPLLTSLVKDETYRIRFKYTGDGNTYENYFYVKCPL